MSEDEHEALRGSRRVKVFQPAAMVCAQGRVRVHLLDVSRTGILGHTRSPPEPGERVELECAGLAVPALVRWRDGQRFGLEFETPLAPQELDRLARLGGADSLPRPAPDPGGA